MAAAAVLLFGVAGGLVGWKLRQVASDLKSARSILHRVETEVSDGRLAAARSDLATAQVLVARANARVYGGIEFDLVDWLPVVHQNIRSLRGSVGLAYKMVNGGVQVLASAQPLQGPGGRLELSLRHGGIPLATVVATQQATTGLASVLPAPDESPSDSLLVGPVADLQRTVQDEAVKRRAQLEVLARGMTLLDEMAGANGPRRYLIAVANTAEERGAGGMILSFGELDAAGGQFKLGPFGSVDKLTPGTHPVAAPADLPADYERRWDGYSYDSNFRQATLAADFPTVAPMLAQLYTSSTGKPVDGVIQIDPSGLAAILEGTGPVLVPGVGMVSARNVVDLTMNQAYFRFPNNDQRRDVLSNVARACFDKLLNGEYPSLRHLASALSDSVAGRHVLMWTEHQAGAQQLRFFDADGALPDPSRNYLSLTVQNMSGNKLDYYLDTAMDVRSIKAPPGDSRRFLDVTVTLHNTAPLDGTLPYVFGPFEPPLVRGRYHGVVSLYVPAGTALLGADGPAATVPAVYSEGGREAVSFEVNTDAGRTDRIVLRLALGPQLTGDGELLLVPQARIRPTSVSVHVGRGDGGGLVGRVTLDRAWLLRPDHRPVPASGPKTAEAGVD